MKKELASLEAAGRRNSPAAIALSTSWIWPSSTRHRRSHAGSVTGSVVTALPPATGGLAALAAYFGYAVGPHTDPPGGAVGC